MTDAATASLLPALFPRVGEEGPLHESSEGYLANLKSDLRRRVEHLTAQKAHVQVEYDRMMAELEAQLRPLEATLAVLTGEQPEPPRGTTATAERPSKPAPKKKRRSVGSSILVTRANGTATGFGITVEDVGLAVAKIKELVAQSDDKTFTQRDMYEPLGWDQGKGSQAVRWLRSIGYLRKAGFHNRREQWAIMDPDAYDNIVRGVKERRDEYQRLLRKGPLDHEDRTVRAAAFIRKHKKVKGWKALEEGCEIPDSVLNTIRQTLLEERLIRVNTTQRGRPVEIEWIGGRA